MPERLVLTVQNDARARVMLTERAVRRYANDGIFKLIGAMPCARL